MSAIQTSIRIRKEAFTEIKRMSEETGREFSVITNELIAEAIKMRRCPGIVFADGVTGRRARIAGTGLEVWEVVSTWQHAEESWKKLKTAYDWLSESQLRSAIGYYASYPVEIDRLVQANKSMTEDRVAEMYPALSISSETAP